MLGNCIVCTVNTNFLSIDLIHFYNENPCAGIHAQLYPQYSTHISMRQYVLTISTLKKHHTLTSIRAKAVKETLHLMG